MSGHECYLNINFPKTNTDGCCVYQQETFIGPVRWLEPVSKRPWCLGCAHTCMMGMLAVLLPLPCFSSSFSSSRFSSLAVACLNEGYELCCLLSGLVLGCVSAWLAEGTTGLRLSNLLVRQQRQSDTASLPCRPFLSAAACQTSHQHCFQMSALLLYCVLLACCSGLLALVCITRWLSWGRKGDVNLFFFFSFSCIFNIFEIYCLLFIELDNPQVTTGQDKNRIWRK